MPGSAVAADHPQLARIDARPATRPAAQRKRVRLGLSAILAVVACLVAFTPATASAATSYEPVCNAPVSRTVPSVGAVTAWHCPIWAQAPVEGRNWNNAGSPDTLGLLHSTGYANWFVCADFEPAEGAYLAFTEADNGQWGWVSGYYYSGDSDYWPSTLQPCSNGILSHYATDPSYKWCATWCSWLPTSALSSSSESALPMRGNPKAKPDSKLRQSATTSSITSQHQP
jgi:hypothetical protein